MNPSAAFAYRKAWKALNTMLEEGRSYSGFERNCAFLNLGGPEARFGDISGASGLDLIDDGRSIAVVDWDLDGKLDFWISNRTAPRLRLQHNRSKTENSFVSIKLRGDGKASNRDGIGARVELLLKNTTPKKVVRTLRAGEGFLAQSSKWVHFGIAAGEEVSGLRVLWPGGESEEISGILAGGFFTVDQGSGVAQRWRVARARQELEKLPIGEPAAPSSQAARIVMASPLPLPKSTYLALDGTRQPIARTEQLPQLINLWATWCVPCVAEMDGWTNDEATLRKLGIDILALSVDKPDDPAAARSAIVAPFLAKRKFPFTTGLADAEFLEVIEVAGRAQIDKFESLPVPSSLLLDAQGRIAFIYKGPVEAAQLAGDVALLGAGKARLHAEAAHFPGRWIDGPWPATPTVMIDKFMSFGQPEAAKRYLDQFSISQDERAQRDLAESYFLVASELRIQKNFPESLEAFAHAVRLNPQNTRARLELATLLFRMQRYGEAIPHLSFAVAAQPEVHNSRKMLSLSLIQTNDHAKAAPHLEYLSALDPTDAIAKLWYGHSLAKTNRGAEAEKLFREALRLQPDSVLIVNELAWLLATHTDPKIYQPEEALQLAIKAANATRGGEARVLDTLAAAQAANGDFAAAIRTIDRGISLAEAAKDLETSKQMQTRRGRYSAGKAYRSP